MISRRRFGGIAGLFALLGAGCAPRVVLHDSGLVGHVVSQCQPQGKRYLMKAERWTIAPSRSRVAVEKARPKSVDGPRKHPHSILDPLLDRFLGDSTATEPETVLVTFDERVAIPRFPDLDETKPRSDPVNLRRLLEARSTIRTIRSRRDSLYRKERAALERNPGVRVLESLWLTPTVVVTAPPSTFRALTRLEGVRSIEAVHGEEPPPCPDPGAISDNHYPGDDVAAGLEVLRSEGFRSLGLPGGTISLLDTGYWPQHILLQGANLGIRGDCVHGGIDCQQSGNPGFDPSDQCRDGRGHGTAAAAVLVGTNALGPAWRGGLGLMLDSFQVYEPGPCGGCGLCLSRLAAHHAFQTAVENLDRVIVANVIARLDESSSLCQSATAAFEAGAIVVAANGNTGPALWTVASPAAASRVLGVGSRVLGALDQTEVGQSHGPAEGDRLKPDIQAPTGCETARYRSECPDARQLLGSFNGTSGAAPFAGVAAALLRDWMKAANPNLEPGHVYAGLILCGRSYGTAIDDEIGAGLIEMPTDCCFWFGAEDVHEGTAVEIPIDLGSTDALDHLEAALWWAEAQTVDEADDEPLQHDDVDLAILDPGGGERGTSEHVWSVFERANAPVEGVRGVWKVKIRGRDFYAPGRDGGFPSPDVVDPDRVRRVYWAVAARRPGEAPPP